MLFDAVFLQGSDTFALEQDVEFRLLLVQECGGVEDSILYVSFAQIIDMIL